MKKTKTTKKEIIYLYYWLGYRDAVASILAENKDKHKMPELAEYYEKIAKERHFSHDYHTTK